MIDIKLIRLIAIGGVVGMLTFIQMPVGQAAPAGQSMPLGVTEAPCPSCAPQMDWVCIHGGSSCDDKCDPASCGI